MRSRCSDERARRICTSRAALRVRCFAICDRFARAVRRSPAWRERNRELASEAPSLRSRGSLPNSDLLCAARRTQNEERAFGVCSCCVAAISAAALASLEACERKTHTTRSPKLATRNVCNISFGERNNCKVEVKVARFNLKALATRKVHTKRALDKFLRCKLRLGF